MICLLSGAGCGRIGFDQAAPADAAADAADMVADGTLVELTMRGSTGCVRSTDGRVACWGRNAEGQAGNGGVATKAAPGVVPIERVTRVFSGEFSTFALDEDGVVWAWGSNTVGQLGLGEVTEIQTVPRRVALTARVRELAAGQFHACAVSEAGEVWCWGANDCGQLGTGVAGGAANPQPTRVPGLSGIAAVAVHDALSCATSTDGALRCWGAVINAGGACQQQQLVPTAPVGLPVVASVTGGCHMAMCAVDPAGDPWCWGESLAGNLGDGTNLDQLDPVRVSSLQGVREISPGFNTTCARTTDAVHCWGTNTSGQLGLDPAAIAASVVPVEMPAFHGASVDDLEVGCNAVCARTGGEVACWGTNASGELGDPALEDAWVPVTVTVPLDMPGA